MINALRLLTATIILSLFTGCAMFRQSITEQDPQESEQLGARYDHKTLLKWGNIMSKRIISHPFMAKHDRPFIADLGIQNRTREHLDMQALADTITTHMLDSGKVRLANTADRDKMLKEQGFQLANCTMDSRVKIGKMLGAKYMMTGSLTEMTQEGGREVRVSKKRNIYYQLTINVTDLETGEIVMKAQEDQLRRETKPLIGW